MIPEIDVVASMVRYAFKVGSMVVTNEDDRRKGREPTFTQEQIDEAVNAAIGATSR